MDIVNDASFEEAVLKAETPVLVDFFADWCGPCRLLGPMLTSLSEEMTNIKFVKYDTEQGEIYENYDVSVLPTLVLFKDGQAVTRQEGLLPKPQLKSWLEENTTS